MNRIVGIKDQLKKEGSVGLGKPRWAMVHLGEGKAAQSSLVNPKNVLRAQKGLGTVCADRLYLALMVGAAPTQVLGFFLAHRLLHDKYISLMNFNSAEDDEKLAYYSLQLQFLLGQEHQVVEIPVSRLV